VVSIWAAIRGAFTALPLREAIGHIAGGAWGLTKALWSSPDKELGAERMNTCRTECPFFNKEYETCGTPGKMEPDSTVHQEGCWCYLPLVVGYKKKTCYARNRGLSIGWKR